MSNFDKIHLALKKNNILKRAYKKIEQGSRRKKDKLLPNIRTNMFFLESMTTNLSFFFFFQRILSSLITLPTSWFCLLLWTNGEYLESCSQEDADTRVFLHIKDISWEHLQSKFFTKSRMKSEDILENDLETWKLSEVFSVYHN